MLKDFVISATCNAGTK